MVKPVDGGAGASSGTPKSSTMKFYKQVMGSAGGYNSRGNPTKTGGQTKKVPGGVSTNNGDPTSGMGKYEGGAKANSKAPRAKVSKISKKPHSLNKGGLPRKVN